MHTQAIILRSPDAPENQDQERDRLPWRKDGEGRGDGGAFVRLKVGWRVGSPSGLGDE